MKITWLGQAGLLFETDTLKIMVDPYLSDSVAAVNPAMHRRVPVDESLLTLQPDVIILTHGHLDHTDPDTLKYFLNTDRSITVLAAEGAWQKARAFGGSHNYVQFRPYTQWSMGNVRFSAVHAEHSDPNPIGVLLEAEGKTYYVTGDTLYNTKLFADIPEGLEAVFLPVNGVGNNMNLQDAARFCQILKPHYAVPLHWGLFDNLDPSDFEYAGRIIPAFYQEIPFPQK